MAHIWLQNSSPGWTAYPLTGSEASLASFLREAAGSASAADHTPADVRLLRTGSQSEEEWAVLAAPERGITVNGIPLPLGILILRDRDEIRWGRSASAFYSTEELAAVVNLPRWDRKVFCPRCKQEIVAETSALRCPGCGVWHHQSEQLPCYTYSEICATCTRNTRLDGGYDWVPET